MKRILRKKGKYVVFSLICENEKSENFFSLREIMAKSSLVLFIISPPPQTLLQNLVGRKSETQTKDGMA